MILAVCFLLFCTARTEVYFKETFDEGFEDHWVYSEDKSVTHGVFIHDQHQYCSDGDKSIKSLNDSSHYHVSSKFLSPIDTKTAPLYALYVVQYTQKVGCGGGYIKLLPEFDQQAFSGQTPYLIMIGPDVCGGSTQTLHLIIAHKGTNYELKEKLSFVPDSHPHLVELYIGPDKKFYLALDGEKKVEGLLEDHFEYLPPKMIDDPADKKPEDWVDEMMMTDPNDKKPEDWDDKQDIADPNSKKPEDWDDEVDGEWQPEFMKNPNFKGKWAPKQTTNPNYKGKWEPKQIPNPAFQTDNSFADGTIQYVGIDLWTVEAGTRFDDFLVTDDPKEAEAHKDKMTEKIKEMIEKQKKDQPIKEDIPPHPEGEIPDLDSGHEHEDEDEGEGEDEHEDL